MFGSDWILFWHRHRQHQPLQHWEVIHKDKVIDIRPFIARRTMFSLKQVAEGMRLLTLSTISAGEAIKNIGKYLNGGK